MHRLLLDEGIARSAARILSERGIDAVHVGDHGLAAAADTEVLEFARSQNRTCCTLDADFHGLLAAQSALMPSVIRVRIEGLQGPAMADLIIRVLEKTGEQLRQGAAITVTRSAIRVRRLPLGRKRD